MVISRVAPGVTRTGEVASLKPPRCTRIEYGPAVTPENRKLPPISLCTVRRGLPPPRRSSTVASGPDAPLGSVTAPWITVCAPTQLAQPAIRNRILAMAVMLPPAACTRYLQSQNVSLSMNCICRGVPVPIAEVV